MISKFFEYAGVLLALLFCTGLIRWVLTLVFPMTRSTASTISLLAIGILVLLAWINKDN